MMSYSELITRGSFLIIRRIPFDNEDEVPMLYVVDLRKVSRVEMAQHGSDQCFNIYYHGSPDPVARCDVLGSREECKKVEEMEDTSEDDNVAWFRERTLARFDELCEKIVLVPEGPASS